MQICDYLSRPIDAEKLKMTTYKDLRHPVLEKIKAPPNLPFRLSNAEFEKVNEQHIIPIIDLLHKSGINVSKQRELQVRLVEQPNRLPIKVAVNTPQFSQLIEHSDTDCVQHDKRLYLDQTNEGRVLLATLTDSMLNVESFQQMQKHDAFCIKIIERVADKNSQEAKNYFFKSGVLMKRTQKMYTPYVLVVPECLIKSLLQYFHGSFATAHCGSRKLINILQARFYWPRLAKMTKKYVRECPLCLYQKPSRVAVTSHGITPTPSRPNQLINIDLVGPFPRSIDNARYLLTVIDEFTKFAIAIPIPSKETETVAKALVQHWITVFGQPMKIHSDQGGDTDSPFISELCQTLNIQKSRTPGYSPWSNGGIERFHSTMETTLRIMMTNVNSKYWSRQIPYIIMAYNGIPHSTTKMAPNMILFGNNNISNHIVPVIPIDHPMYTTNDHLKAIREAQQLSWSIVKQHILASKRSRYNPTKSNPFKLGQFVLIKNHAFKGLGSKKLANKYEGPYRIIRKYPNTLGVVHYTKDWNPNSPPPMHHQHDDRARIEIKIVNPRHCIAYTASVEPEMSWNDKLAETFFNKLKLTQQGDAADDDVDLLAGFRYPTHSRRHRKNSSSSDNSGPSLPPPDNAGQQPQQQQPQQQQPANLAGPEDGLFARDESSSDSSDDEHSEHDGEFFDDTIGHQLLGDRRETSESEDSDENAGPELVDPDYDEASDAEQPAGIDEIEIHTTPLPSVAREESEKTPSKTPTQQKQGKTPPRLERKQSREATLARDKDEAGPSDMSARAQAWRKQHTKADYAAASSDDERDEPKHPKTLSFSPARKDVAPPPKIPLKMNPKFFEASTSARSQKTVRTPPQTRTVPATPSIEPAPPSTKYSLRPTPKQSLKAMESGQAPIQRQKSHLAPSQVTTSQTAHGDEYSSEDEAPGELDRV
jgi:transposase InsO family protein